LRKAASTHPSTLSQTVETEIVMEEMIVKMKVVTEEIMKMEAETEKATVIEKIGTLIHLQFL
jgi:hypothetical protein